MATMSTANVEQRESETHSRRQQKSKRPIACTHCRAKKVRCDGGRPCTNCIDHSIECIPPLRMNRIGKKGKEHDGPLEDRLARMESIIQANKDVVSAAQVILEEHQYSRSQRQPGVSRGSKVHFNIGQETELAPPQDDLHPHRVQSSPMEHESENLHIFGIRDEVPTGIEPARSVHDSIEKSTASMRPDKQQGSYRRGHFSMAAALQTDQAISPTPYVSESRRTPGNIYATSPARNPRMAAASIPTPIYSQEGSSVISADYANSEYHGVYTCDPYRKSLICTGPRSFLSICSKPGTQWVAKATGVTEFDKTASQLTLDITRRLKMDRNLFQETVTEPDMETAWRFTNAYFENAPDTAFGIIHRPQFEAQLRAQFDGRASKDEASWYALRNTIYAFGCRLEVSKTADFREAYIASWRYLQNALSVHSELLYFRTGLMAIQALILMAYFVEGLGSPNLEYMLCSNAIRLAQSKGFHRQAAASWEMTETEICHRNWIFWAIYVYEKHIAFRAGRPSAIHDSDISCQIPTTAPFGSSTDVTYCTIIVKLAQLSSAVTRKFSSVKMFRKTPDEIVRAVFDLEAQLCELKESVVHFLPLDSPIEPGRLSPGMTLEKALHMQYAYYGILSDIHSVLTYPWFHYILYANEHAVFHNQMALSSETVAKASRAIILATVHLKIDANCQVMLVFFYPIYALINLFVHILKNPNSPSVQSDIALLDVGAGHFARIEFATNSEFAFPFVRDIAALARIAMKRARATQNKGPTFTDDNPFSTRAVPAALDMTVTGLEGTGLAVDNGFNEHGAMDMFDFEMESWSTFLPSINFDNS